MDKNTVLEAILFMENTLKTDGLNVDKMIIFGSHARAAATKESDIDVAIISQDFEDKDIFERIEMTKNAEIQTIKKYLLPLDIITLSPEELRNENSLIAAYAKKGKVVFSAATST
jgi:predicted nucleotidyltransferase